MGLVLTFDTKRCIISEEDLEQISNPKGFFIQLPALATLSQK
jgi:hypothetical protein